MLRGMIKLIYYFLIAYLIYSVIRLLRSLRKKESPRPANPLRSGMMVKDEACNVYLPKEEAIQETINGKDYYFCSKECLKKFLKEKKGKA